MNFSLLMSIYKNDNPDRLEKCLKSITNSSITPEEIVLVIDGPISNPLEEKVQDFSDKFHNLRLLRLRENCGLGIALSKGLALCSNEIVARMDADDEVIGNRFEIQLNIMRNPNIGIVGAYIEEVPDILLDYDHPNIRKVPKIKSKMRWTAIFLNPFNHMTVMFRKSAITSVGSYKPMNRFEDYYLWLRLLKSKWDCQNIPVPLVRATTGSSFFSRRSGWSYYKDEINFYKQCLDEGIIPFGGFIVGCGIRASMRLLPARLVSSIYNFFLRKQSYVVNS
jgi:glycosyltransferase involved in cell wall biosynthesis